MALFVSTYVNKVDKKGRVSVPASFRQALAKTSAPSTIFVWPSLNCAALEGADQDFINVLSDSLESPDLDAKTRETIETFVFGKMVELTIDPEGRVVLPRELSQSAGIAEDASFMGRRKTFQIWNPGNLNAHEDTLRTEAQQRDISLSQVVATAQRTSRPAGDAA